MYTKSNSKHIIHDTHIHTLCLNCSDASELYCIQTDRNFGITSIGTSHIYIDVTKIQNVIN